jgi:hypothetical protein
MNDKKTPYFMERWWLTGYLFTIGLAWFTQPPMSTLSVILFTVVDLFLWPIYVGAVLGKLIAQVLQ